MKVKIEKIKVGSRIREDVGDIHYLEDSIKKIGLLHPITVDQNYQLLSGQRRLKACQNLGWNEVEITVIPLKNKLLAIEIESHENLIRKDFSDREIEILVHKKSQLARKNILTYFFYWIKDIIQKFLDLFQKKI